MAKIDYPKEHFLIVRRCLKKTCNDNKPAAKLLSYFLFLYENDKQQNEDVFIVRKTQDELIDGLLDEITVKTLHDTAIPVLRLLGYIDAQEIKQESYKQGVIEYTIYIDRVTTALSIYKKQDTKKLAQHLADNIHLQLEKFPIVGEAQQLEKFPIELEKFPIELEKFPIELEKFLNVIRKISNCKRGRKPIAQATQEGKNATPPDLNKDLNKNNKEYILPANASASPQNDVFTSSDEKSSSQEEPQEELNDWLPPDSPTQEEKKPEKPNQQALSSVTTEKEEPPKKPRGSRNGSKKERTAPLALPDLDGPVTQESLLQLAEYLRGYHYTPAKLNKATEDGVKPLLELGFTLRQIDTVWRLLSSKQKLRDEIGKPWLVDRKYVDGGYSLDIWNLPDKMEAKLQLAAKLEKQHSPAQVKPDDPQEKPVQDDNQLVLWTRTSLEQFPHDLLENCWYQFVYMPLSEAIQHEYDIYGPLVPKQKMEIENRLELERQGKIQRPLIPVA